MSNKYPFSLCCLSPTLSLLGFSMKTMTATRFNSMERSASIKELSSRTLSNLKFTLKAVEFCASDLNISGYRMSSGIFPLMTYFGLNIEEYPDHEQIMVLLREIGDTSRKLNIRLSFHPGEYTTVTSENPKSVYNSLADLEHHAWVMDRMGLEASRQHPINFHIRKDGDPTELSKTAIQNINTLSDSCRNRITLEVNDNKNGTWTVEQLKSSFYDTVGIPIVFDSLHCARLDGNKSISENLSIAQSTWGNIRPLFHYSCGVGDTKSHADFNTDPFPVEFLTSGCDWDIELKSKCLAIKKLISEVNAVV
jgi:UV DNA damage endonuclease